MSSTSVWCVRKVAKRITKKAFKISTLLLEKISKICIYKKMEKSHYRRRINQDSLQDLFTRQHIADSKVIGYKVFNLDSGFKISRHTTKLGRFCFGFTCLCINGKTNPVLKHHGFVTSPENFPSSLNVVYGVSITNNRSHNTIYVKELLLKALTLFWKAGWLSCCCLNHSV